MNKKFFMNLSRLLMFLILFFVKSEIFADDNMKNFVTQVAGRALIVKDNQLLLVSNDGNLWYTPGGRLEPNETILDCIKREVMEETGLNVRVKDLISVFEFFDTKDSIHKVELYFKVSIENGNISNDWVDLGGPVKHVKFFSLKEIKSAKNVVPSFLKEGKWLNDTKCKIYNGSEIK